MNHQNHNTGSGPSIRIGDVYYVLFRHKWKILFIWLLGTATAAYLWFSGWEQKWMSEAKLMVKYVVETKQPTASPTEGLKKVEESPIATECQILRSMDVATDVAQTLARTRPDVIQMLVGDEGGSNAWELAIGPIQTGLKLEVPEGSSVIVVGFQHPDRNVVRPVLQELITVYLDKHVVVHQGEGLFDRPLEIETRSLKEKLRRTEEQLRDARAKLGVVSIDDAKKFNMDQLQRVRQLIFDAQTDLLVGEQSIGLMLANRHMTNGTSAAAPLATKVPPDKAAEYGRLRAQYENLLRREQEYLVSFTPESKMVKGLRDQMQGLDQRKQELETEYPSLMITSVGDNKESSRTDPLSEAAYRTNALHIRLAGLKAQVKFYEDDLKRLDTAEAEITELQRDRERQEQNFKYFSITWDQTQANSRLRAGQNASISPIQAASMPFPAPTKRLKTIASILFACFAGALGLAFALEFVVDRSFRRPVEVERSLGLPLFISIPRMKLNGHVSPALPDARKMIKDADGEQDGKLAVAKKSDVVANWEPNPALCPFAETLRDRLITYFEMKGLTHKPKLVAVTSCGEGSGVSTISAGLAASLSETGEGNVLLVDMNIKNGAAHQFHRGALAYGIDEALQRDKRDGAMVQDKLYVASEAGQGEPLPTSALPQRFKNLVPKLKASDYDYIIFDMPPVSQISMTPRLAKFMDMVLMVVESEKTDRDVVKRATHLLAETKTNVGVVLNKSRNYVPKALQQELA